MRSITWKLVFASWCSPLSLLTVELRGIHASGPGFLLQELQQQLDDSTYQNKDLKEQVALAEHRNSLLQSELEELRSLQEQTERGRKLAEKELLGATERINLFHTQVGHRSSSLLAGSVGWRKQFTSRDRLRICMVAMSSLRCGTRCTRWLHLSSQALGSQSSCNKAPPTDVFKQVYFFTVLGASHPHLGIARAVFPLKLTEDSGSQVLCASDGFLTCFLSMPCFSS